MLSNGTLGFLWIKLCMDYIKQMQCMQEDDYCT
jgi:hypothetical protein